ncbi:MAG: hypothetical protein KF899_15110 [Parvibaculum sp.]|nr:hypothetical protein [Parvibaculum sp.]
MLLFIVLFLLALVLLAILSSIGRRKTEERASRVAAANYERIKREAPNSTYASMGPNEFLEEYNRFLRRRGYKIMGVFVLSLLVLTLVWSALYPYKSGMEWGDWIAISLGTLVVVTAYMGSTGGRFPKWPRK